MCYENFDSVLKKTDCSRQLLVSGKRVVHRWREPRAIEGKEPALGPILEETKDGDADDDRAGGSRGQDKADRTREGDDTNRNGNTRRDGGSRGTNAGKARGTKAVDEEVKVEDEDVDHFYEMEEDEGEDDEDVDHSYEMEDEGEDDDVETENALIMKAAPLVADMLSGKRFDVASLDAVNLEAADLYDYIKEHGTAKMEEMGREQFKQVSSWLRSESPGQGMWSTETCNAES